MSADKSWAPPVRSNERLARPLKTAERVAREVLRDIMLRNLPAGTTLAAEAEMIERYGVGRASLREALRILEVHGLIRMKTGPGGGPILVEVDSHAFARTSSFYFHLKGATLRDLLVAKTAIEPMLARLAAERLTEESEKTLLAVLEAERQEMDDSPHDWGMKAADFHSAVARMSGNPVLDLFGLSIVDIQTERLRIRVPMDEREGAWEIHRRIATAIIAGDGAQAERLTQRHANSVLDRLDRLLPGVLDEVVDWW